LSIILQNIFNARRKLFNSPLLIEEGARGWWLINHHLALRVLLTGAVYLSHFDYKIFKVLRKLQMFAFSPHHQGGEKYKKINF